MQISVMAGQRQIVLSDHQPQVLVDGIRPYSVEGVLVDKSGQFIRVWLDNVYSNSFRVNLSPVAAKLLGGKADAIPDAIYTNTAQLMATSTPTPRYRIVVGETGSEQGDIIETKATTERGARIVLGRELAKYGGDGWGFIEIDLYDDGRWDRYGVRGKGE